MNKQKLILLVLITLTMLITVSFLLIEKFNGGDDIMPIKQNNNINESTDLNKNSVIKNNEYTETDRLMTLLGTDEKGWNIYQSNDFGFEIKMPKEWELGKAYFNDKDNYNYIFLFTPDSNDYITIKISDKYNDLKINNKEDFLDWKCKNYKNRESCFIYYKDMFFRLVSKNNINIIEEKEYNGVESIEYSYYIFDQNNLFIFSMEYAGRLDDNFMNKEDVKRTELFSDIINTFRMLK